MLCERCQRREATIFLVEAIEGAPAKSTKLCAECGGAEDIPFNSEYMDALRNAACRYCGSKPCVPGRNFSTMAQGVKPEGFLCISCHVEYLRFMELGMLKGESIAGLPRDEQSGDARPDKEKADAHMKEWVEAMRNAGCRYCGGKPCVAGDTALFALTGDAPEGFLCAPCQREQFQFSAGIMGVEFDSRKKKEQAGDCRLSAEEYIAAIRAIRDKTGEHMKEWLRRN